MNNPAQLCSICDSPAVDSGNGPCGALVSSPFYPNDRYRVVLCDGCFMRCLADLRRDRLVHTMFYDTQDDLENFGRVPAADSPPEREATLSMFLDALERDIQTRPDRVAPLTAELIARIKALVGTCDVELSAPLPPEH